MSSAATSTSTKIILCEWEANGYHDSYFYGIAFDTTTSEIVSVSLGATAYGGGADAVSHGPITPAIALAVRTAIRDRYIAEYRTAEVMDIETPADASNGQRLSLIRNVRHRGEKYLAGTEGTVFYCHAFGTFYRNGYNRPCRGNRRVGLRLDDGSSIYVALSACKRVEAPLTDDALMDNAERVARNAGAVKGLTGCRAWLSSDYISAPIAALDVQTQPTSCVTGDLQSA